MKPAERRLAERVQTHAPLLLLQDIQPHVLAAAYLANSSRNSSSSCSSSGLEARVNRLALFRSFFVEYFALFLEGVTANATLLLGLVCLLHFNRFHLIKNHYHLLHEQQQQQQAAALAIASASRICCKQKSSCAFFGSCWAALLPRGGIYLQCGRQQQALSASTPPTPWV